MLKTGIYKLSQLTPKNILSHKKISISLYNELCDIPDSGKLIEQALLLFTDENGVYKRTLCNRFEEFDKKVIELIKNNFSSQSLLYVEDVAISDGRTAVDFFNKISPFFPHLSFRGSDYGSEIFIIKKGRTTIVLNAHHKLLEIVFAPFVFNATRFIKKDFLYPLNLILFFFLKFLVVPPLIEAFRTKKIKGEKVLLFCPEARRLSRKERRFKLTQHNILSPFQHSEKIDIIRAMNVLNPSYFNPIQIEKIISNIFNGLKEKGYFITGSNEDSGSLVHGNIYQKTGQRFKKIEQSGNGSPVQKWIDLYSHGAPFKKK